MKKKIIFIILAVFLVLGVGVFALFLFLNREKESMSGSEFKSFMEKNNYVVIDTKSQFSNYDYIVKSYLATKSDYSFKIEFYELSDDTYAINFYNNNMKIFEQENKDNYAKINVSLKNYSKYTLSTDKKFKVVSRIDNTVAFVNVDNKYKDEVNKLLKDMGY